MSKFQRLTAHAAHPGIFWIFSVFGNGNSFLQLLLFGGCYVLSLLSRACVGIEVSVQLTLLVFHSTSLLCLLHDRPAARSRPAALRAPVAARSRAIPPRSRPMLPCDPVTPRAPIPQACCQDFGPAARISLCCQDFGTAARIPVPLPGFRPRFQDFITRCCQDLNWRCQDFGHHRQDFSTAAKILVPFPAGIWKVRNRQCRVYAGLLLGFRPRCQDFTMPTPAGIRKVPVPAGIRKVPIPAGIR